MTLTAETGQVIVVDVRDVLPDGNVNTGQEHAAGGDTAAGACEDPAKNYCISAFPAGRDGKCGFFLYLRGFFIFRRGEIPLFFYLEKFLQYKK